MRSITEVPAHCPAFFCPWGGVTGECESGPDGVLLCPECGVPVIIEYSEEERFPQQHSGDER